MPFASRARVPRRTLRFVATLETLGFPTAHNSTFHRGTEAGPARMWQVLFDGASNLTTESGVDLAARSDWQDLHTVDVPPGQAGFDTVHRAVSSRLMDGKTLLHLGGDHGITYPIVAAHADQYPDLTIVHLDAHPDLYDVFEGNRLSHACPFARILEGGHCRRLVQIGIRAANDHQQRQAERFGVETFEAWRLPHIADLGLEPPIYVSLDLDVFDPAHAPGVAHHEPGGVTPRTVFDLLRELSGVVGADVVELNPERDHADVTAALAAKCCKELLACLIAGPR